MSGLEIVGVVLGAIPIAVAAIETYRKRQNRIKFRNKAPFIMKLISSLNAQHWILLSDIQRTLNNAGVEYDRSNPQLSPAIFQDPDIAEAVDEYLGQDRNIYYDAIRRCHRVLAELVGSIEGLDPVPQSLTDLVKTYKINDGLYEFPKKLRFPLKRDALDRQIREMEQATSVLGRITDNMAALRVQAPLQSTSRQVAVLASALNTMRQHARNLYSAISAAYQSQCHTRHEARLFLRSCSNVVEKKSTLKVKKDMSFTVLFSPAISLSSTLPSYRGDIKVLNGKATANTCPTATSTQTRTRSTFDDICGSIRKAKERGLVLDIYLSDNRYLSYSHVHGSRSSKSPHIMVESDAFMTLEDLLMEKSSTPWPQNHRMALSLVIVSSLMQLITTPWLRVPLTSSSVQFARSALDIARLDLSAIPEPFVEEEFCTSNGFTTRCRDCNARQYMTELGILLLEIEHWKTAEEYKQELLSHGQPVPVSRYDLASSWLGASMYHVLQFHHEVITRCVECTFATNHSTLSWDDPALRKSIAEYVLKPLQDNCLQQLR